MSVFRSTYRTLSGTERAHVARIKQLAEELYQELSFPGTAAPSREFALAKTNLEQAVMWAVKAITG